MARRVYFHRRNHLPDRCVLSRLVCGAMAPLILQRGKTSRPSGQWRDDDYECAAERRGRGRMSLIMGDGSWKGQSDDG